MYLTKSLNVFALQNFKVEPEVLSKISPYRPGNINHFGKYEIAESSEEINLDGFDLENQIRDLSPMC